ncbi:phosphatidylserine decarboxylase [Ornithinibacillus sp. 4-3]|uniref:Phosphatidylserine decarboxylase proenzyme n=1 Tax=Ornithinibacillus sp. 4-3 TaxID=3231488 RepID=A0AB39HQW8_9BACI
MNKKKLLKYFINLTGNRYSSTALRKFSQSGLSKPLIRPFARTYRINIDEMKLPLNAFGSLHDFFTRELKPDLRPINQSPNILISPVDAVVESMGIVRQNNRFSVKDQQYTLEQIFGSTERAKTYESGYYFILYLSPRDYHRFHYPIDGKVGVRYALGEKSYPVNQMGLQYGDTPFATNYRIISELETAYGKVAMIKVGALNVNSIQLSHSDEHFSKGEELGYFSFGSTVILFIEKNNNFSPLVQEKEKLQLGKPLAVWE